MGLTYITARAANPARPRKSARLKFLVDAGAAYSIVPEPVLKRLGIQPRTVRRFILADGKEIRRRMGGALFLYKGEEGLSPVIFGEKGDSHLLGVVSLEALGLVFDPFRRELRPLPLVLGSADKICQVLNNCYLVGNLPIRFLLRGAEQCVVSSHTSQKKRKGVAPLGLPPQTRSEAGAYSGIALLTWSRVISSFSSPALP